MSFFVHDTSAPILHHRTFRKFKGRCLLGDPIKTGTSQAFNGRMTTPMPRFPQVQYMSRLDPGTVPPAYCKFWKEDEARKFLVLAYVNVNMLGDSH